MSAGSMFPALVLRSQRGVIVGRETMGAYHFLNALKHTNIVLPNSTFQVRIPMVHVVFDTTVNERVPFGRGVIPDYTAPWSLEEIYTEGDFMLNYTLQLIENGEYLKENPFEISETRHDPAGSRSLTLIGGGLAMAGIFAFTVVSKRRKTAECVSK